MQGTVEVRVDRDIPAYGIELQLEREERTRYDGPGEAKQWMYKKVKSWVQTELLQCFPNGVCPKGSSSVPFTFSIPPNLP